MILSTTNPQLQLPPAANSLPGMSCAYHLSQHPDKFAVTLIDSVSYCGGQAFSIPLDKHKHGASWLNQGVQGGSYIFHHTLTMFARQGYAANPVELHVSFGKGDSFWTNVYPTKLLERHQKEVKRFARMLRVVRAFEVLFALLPIKLLMKLFAFSYEFANAVALPMVALFLGTGNYTPEVPSIILERLCTSPTYGMWYPPDDKSIASNTPPMVVFPNFGNFYDDWRKDLERQGVEVRLATELTQVVERGRKGVVVRTIKRTPAQDGHNPASAWAPEDETNNADAGAVEVEERYDELVLCCLYVIDSPSLPVTAIGWRTVHANGCFLPLVPTRLNAFWARQRRGANPACSARPSSPTTSPSRTATLTTCGATTRTVSTRSRPFRASAASTCRPAASTPRSRSGPCTTSSRTSRT